MSKVAILLMFSGRVSSWFLCSHSVCSFSILRNRKQKSVMGWRQARAGGGAPLTPVDVLREVLQVVSTHVQPLQHRHPNDTVWHTGEVVHGQIQVLQFLQVPQLMIGTQSRSQVRGLVQALIWELVRVVSSCFILAPLIFMSRA